MVSSKLLTLSTLSLLPLSLAVPAAIPEPAPAAVQWTPIDFNGKILYINSAVTSSSINPREAATRALRRDGGPPDNDTCDDTTLDPHPGPFANVADCLVIRDWASTQDTYWRVQTNTPDTYGVLNYGTCVFQAGTRNFYTTWIGSTNVRDIIELAVNTWQSGGVVASTGVTTCENDGGSFTVKSATTWTIKHT